MRIALGVLMLAALVAPGGAQMWEKPIAPGVSYRVEIDPVRPSVLHALRWNPTAPGWTGKAEVAGGRVFAAPRDKGRETVSGMARRTGAVAGINADFFPFTGDPLGAMVANGEIISRPDRRRSVFGWGPGGTAVGKLDWKAEISWAGGGLALEGLNEECTPDAAELYTPSAAVATAPVPSVYLVFRTLKGRWTPSTSVEGYVESVVKDQPSVPVPPDGFVVAARGAAATKIAALGRGDQVKVQLRTTGFDWSKIDQVLGGGPHLLIGGKPQIDWRDQDFKEGFANNRHPRTMIGRTAEGDVWLVVVDGRQPMSAGATLAEAAETMRKMGCVDAINLDGGGSSALSVFGVPLNRPSDGAERPVANGLMLFGPSPTDGNIEAAIQGPLRLRTGVPEQYQLIGPNGKPVPAIEVFWSAQGAGWVTPDGQLRPLRVGAASLRATWRGRVWNVDVVVEEVQPPQTTPSRSGARKKTRAGT